MKLFATAFLALTAIGCTASGYMRDAEAGPAPGPDEVKVVVYRNAVVGGVDNFPVYVYLARDNRLQLLGFTETDGYFEYYGRPGKALFIASGEGDAFIEADLVAGHTYTFRAWSKFGWVSSRPGFAPVLPGSDRWLELLEVRDRLQARQLDPETAAQAQRSTEARAKAALADFQSGLRSSKDVTRLHGVPGEGAHGQ